MEKNNEELFRKLIEEIQQKAFMEGYAYAIKVLQEGIPQKEKQSDN